MQSFLLFAQNNNDAAVNAAAAMAGLIVSLIQLGVAILVIAGLWKTFSKAGQPGWAAIIPIYNIIVLLQVAGRPIWWILLFLIPCVNFIFLFIISLDVAKNFGKGAGFGIGLALLGFIFYPILGFGDAKYQPVPH
jgi:hypothetical protein